MWTAEELGEVLAEYVTWRQLPDGRIAAVQRRQFNSTLCVGLDPVTYDQNW